MRIVKWVSIILVLIIVAAVVTLLTLDVNRFKPQIVAAVEGATGRKLDIAADMRLSIFPLGISVKKVSFGNAAWGSRPQMVTVGEFTAQLDLPALIRRQIKIDRLVLSDVDLLLEKDEQGKANWDFAAAAPAEVPKVQQNTVQQAPIGGGSVGGLPVVSDVLLKNVKLAYRDAQTGAKNEVLLRRLSVRQAKSDMLAVKLTADVDGSDIAAEGNLGSLAEMVAPSRPWPVRLAVTVPGATVNIDGTVAEPLQARGLALKVIAEAPDLAKLASRFGAGAPAVPLQLMLSLKSKDPQHFILSDITGKVADSDLSGNGEVVLGGRRPSLKFDMASKSFNLVPLLDIKAGDAKSGGAVATTSTAPAAAAGSNGNSRLFSDDALPLDGLNALDAVISYKAGSFRAPKLDAQNVAVSIALRDGTLNLKPVALDAAGGHADGSVVLNGKMKTLAIKLDASKIDLSSYLKQAGVTDIINSGATTDLTVNITSAGGSLHQLAAALDGTVLLKVGEGDLKEDYMKSFLPRLADAVGILGKATAKTKLYCVVSGLDITKGVVSPKSLLAETGRISLTGQGDINLGTEQLALLLVPSSRNLSLGAALPPVRVRGPLTDPSFSPDPAALAKSVIGTVAGVAALGPLAILSPVLGKTGGDDSPTACAKAVALAEGRPVPQAASSPESGSQQPQSPVKELKDLGKQLKGLFKR